MFVLDYIVANAVVVDVYEILLDMMSTRAKDLYRHCDISSDQVLTYPICIAFRCSFPFENGIGVHIAWPSIVHEAHQWRAPELGRVNRVESKAALRVLRQIDEVCHAVVDVIWLWKVRVDTQETRESHAKESRHLHDVSIYVCARSDSIFA